MLRIILVFCLLFSHAAIARIGENPEQFEQRYGKRMHQEDEESFYYKAPFYLHAEFFQGKAITIVYYKVDKKYLKENWLRYTHKLNQLEIEALLKANGKSAWNNVKNSAIYENKQNGLTALSNDGDFLYIKNDFLVGEKKRARRSEEAEQLRGF